MSAPEFNCIETYFTRNLTQYSDVICGVGDDAAVLCVPSNHQLVVTTDTLIAGVHFPEKTTPHAIGHKALAVNLSDCAAMGATPRWVSVALSLPTLDDAWLRDFCDGFFALADHHGVVLIGGDLTQGALSITITVHGLLPKNKGLYRHAACVGDDVYVTGLLGAAGLALQAMRSQTLLAEPDQQHIYDALNYPQPHIAAGIALLDYAHAAIDISDGFAQDLQHILTASQLGARIELDKLPIHPIVQKAMSLQAAQHVALTAGDDYQLCFTAPPTVREKIQQALLNINIDIHPLGTIIQEKTLRFLNADGTEEKLNLEGYQHFAKHAE